MSEPGATTEMMLAVARRFMTSRKTAFGLAAAAAISGVATVLSLTGPSGRAYDIETVLTLLYVDGILLLMLAVVVVRRLVQIWMERRRGAAGSDLQVRLVLLFSLVAVTPGILVVVFSALFLNFGMQGWFSDRVRMALTEAEWVAKAYQIEHRTKIETDAFALANDLNQNAPLLMRSRSVFNDELSAQAALRSLSEAAVLDGAGQVIARARFSLLPDIENLPVEAIARADQGFIAVIDSKNEERLRALIKLNRFVDAYLLVERLVDPRVMSHIDRIQRALNAYKKMESERSGIQVSFIIIFVMVALLLLLAAGWVGLTVARQLARPISDLIGAAREISDGNLNVRVEASAESDEIGRLGHAFNNMTAQLQAQQRGLIEANRELDARRRFTETVLTGVSAGVVGLDPEGRVYLPNRSASELLSLEMSERIGESFADVVPEMAELLVAALQSPHRTHQAEISLMRRDGMCTLLTRITSETLQSEVIGYVVTFDDVTELLSAQRKAAWADVARRIAHEIKNPLTPIQLSAERLRRKYQDEIKSDPDTFRTCTDTIVRQVEDIGRMVDEFSAFARMPQPTMRQENLTNICRETVFLERNRNPDIKVELTLPDEPVTVRCDSRQISGALTNILKNAAESVEARIASNDLAHGAGWIGVTLCFGAGRGADGDMLDEVRVVVEDNGRGLPADRERLTEPYVTTREKGTGLGLAIVRKIMEDHRGSLILESREPEGAKVTLVIAISAEAKDGSDGGNPDGEQTAMQAAVTLGTGTN
ncbi:MAG: PAS domain-containing sensor histidine kinase [Rhodospirillaceae bacterium]